MKGFKYLDETVILRISEDQCVGCGNCEQVCPHRILMVKNDKAQVVHSGCMECGACVMNCPTGAIYVNPDDGCGCAAYIINSWFAKFRKNSSSECGC